MGLLHSSFGRFSLARGRWWEAGWRGSKTQSCGHKDGKSARNADNRARNASALPTYWRSNGTMRSSVAPRETKPCLDLGDLGAAHGYPVRRRAVEFHDRAVAFLADERDVRHRHDVAAVHPDEQSGVELGFAFRYRPRAHPLPGSVMHLCIVSVGPDAPDVGAVNEMRAVGAFDRLRGGGGGGGRLADAAERRRPEPRAGRGSAG